MKASAKGGYKSYKLMFLTDPTVAAGKAAAKKAANKKAADKKASAKKPMKRGK